MDSNVNKILQNIVNTATLAADEAKAAVHSAGKAVAGKYDEVKMNIELARLSDEQEDVFSDIGRMLFLMHTGAVKDTVMSDEGEKSPQQVIDALLVSAEQVQQEMDVITDKLTVCRNEKVCPCCGRICGEHDAFCAVCGTRLSEEEPEEEKAPAAEPEIQPAAADAPAAEPEAEAELPAEEARRRKQMTYTIYELLCFFVIYSVLGWCLEVCFCTINTGQFVNRGFLNGPVCPIYGFGMVIVLVALTPLAHSLPVLFVGGALLTSALELAAGWILKKVFHTSWWDYSDVPFNLGGYICLKFSLAWGVAVVAVMKGVQPAVAALVRAVPRTLGIVLLCAAGAAFACDLAVTVAGILKLNRDLGHIAEVARLLHAGSDRLAEGLGDTALAVDGKLDATKLDAAARIDIAKAEILDHRNAVARRLLKAFPNMRPAEHEALEQLKSWVEEKNAALRAQAEKVTGKKK